jgi:hypothetical protein
LREGLRRMGRSDLIGAGPQHLVPRQSGGADFSIMEQRRETPGPDRLARKFGQNKPRDGAAVQRQPAGKAGRNNQARSADSDRSRPGSQTASARRK